MKTDNQSINQVLTTNNTSFFIPPFQRSYAWGISEVTRYFEDIIRIIESEQDVNQGDKLEHFFGTIVIKTEKEMFASKSIIVDGQQRLTTTLIFLIALRDTIATPEEMEKIDQLYLKNESSTFEDKIKLKQVTKDWESYKNLVNSEDITPGVIKTSYETFKNQIRRKDYTLDEYIIALSRINVALIFLDERPFKGEDPQIIFETLNSLGKPLTLADLVRNYVLLDMNSYNQSTVYEEQWHPFIENEFKDDTSKYFRDYLQYRMKASLKVVSDNNTKELYHIFKTFVKEQFSDKEHFISDILKLAPLYKVLISKNITINLSTSKQKNDRILELLTNIFSDIKSDPFKPFVLGLLEHNQLLGKLSDEKLIESLEQIKIYLIRRRVVKLTQGENKNIPVLIKYIPSLVSGRKSMFDILSEQQYSLRIPNNIEIEEVLLDLNFYKSIKSYSKLILGKMEEKQAKVSVNFRDPKITIEHIMPQTLNKVWKEELGGEFEAIHSKYLDNIGNLILTEFNSEMGNKSFKFKKEKLTKSSLLFREDILSKDIWDEKALVSHRNKMISLFNDTFALPEQIKYSDNWKSNTIEETTFSPLEEDVIEYLTGEKPKKLLLNNQVFNVGNWQEVYLKFIENIISLDKSIFQTIYNNQERLFNRTDIITNIDILIEDLERSEYNTKLRSYKNIEGTHAHKLEFKSNEYIYHTSADTLTLVNRMALLMKEFNLDEDYVLFEIY